MTPHVPLLLSSRDFGIRRIWVSLFVCPVELHVLGAEQDLPAVGGHLVRDADPEGDAGRTKHVDGLILLLQEKRCTLYFQIYSYFRHHQITSGVPTLFPISPKYSIFLGSLYL